MCHFGGVGYPMHIRAYGKSEIGITMADLNMRLISHDTYFTYDGRTCAGRGACGVLDMQSDIHSPKCMHNQPSYLL